MTEELQMDINLAGELESAKRRASRCRGWEILPGEAKLALVIMEILSMAKSLKDLPKFKEKMVRNEELVELLIEDTKVSAATLFPDDRF